MVTRRRFLWTSGLSLTGFREAPLVGQQPAKVNPALQAAAQRARLEMRIDPAKQTAAELLAWQRQFRSVLTRLLGDFRPPVRWTTQVEHEVRLQDHTRQQLVLSANGHPSLPVYLLVPHRQTNRPGPGILALHGHGPFGYDTVAGRHDLPGVSEAIAKSNYDYGRQLVAAGYVVCIPCMVPFGRRVDRAAYGGQDPCAVTFVRMQLLGKILMAENLRDCLWAYELLKQQNNVIPDRIGCVGLSYGGRMTMLTAALEPSIRCAVVSGALNVMQERIQQRYSCGGQVIPGLLRYGDIPEIGSLIAPRSCIWETGSHDGLIVPPWADDAMSRMRQFYACLGAADRLRRDRFRGGHRWNGTLALPMLKQVLTT